MAENIDKNWVKNINRIFREPDMIFYIDITPQESIRRNTDTKFNIIETEEYLQKVRENYISIAKENHFIMLDGMRPLHH